jgi:hypothetical protein
MASPHVAGTAIVLQSIAFANVAQGTASQIDEPRRVVVRTAEEFQALWKTHSTAPLPKVDFSKAMVVGVFLGMRPTAGYGVSITAVTKSAKGLVVEFREGVPEKGKMVAQLLTSPFHLVSIPRDDGAVEFRQTVR